MRKSGNLTLATPTDREIAMIRVFAAPRGLIFDAYTRPDLLQLWFGPPGWSLAVCEVDLRVGGAYRFVWRGSDGTEMGLRGIYREIAPPERLVSTETFDDPWYPGEAVSTLVLTGQGGSTTLTNTILYGSKEIRDGVLQSSMEHGVAATYDRLAELSASILAEGTV
ncbi:MAG TPA: SRPBCC family protein [Thermoanaerobaculia bacterium]|jgi:uncharacterized protein YndB with AHSA1/START domain|nr:SRPBCC family protein [Thermoanaerobaculia bacterium]